MTNKKILIVGNDIEALLAGFILSEKFDTTVVGSIYKNIEHNCYKHLGINFIRFKESLIKYTNKIPFLTYRFSNVKKSDTLDEVLDFFGYQHEYKRFNSSTEKLFETCRDFSYLDEDSSKYYVDSYNSLVGVYTDNRIRTFSNIERTTESFKHYIDKLYVNNKSKYVFQDSDYFASNKLLRVDFLSLCESLIEHVKPQYHNIELDPKCSKIEDQYDYVFYTNINYSKTIKAYHMCLEFDNFNSDRIYNYDKVYFNDSTDILQLYNSGDKYHLLFKYNEETFKYDKLNFESQIKNTIGSYNSKSVTNSFVIDLFPISSQEEIKITPRLRRHLNKDQFDGKNIFSNTVKGESESIDMFANNVKKIMEYLK